MLRSGVVHRQTVPFLPSQISTKPSSTERAFSRTQGPRGRCQTTREVGVCQASFFDTLFAGSKSGSGSGPNQASDLVSELLDILAKNKRNKKPYIGPDERIEEIVNKLKSFNVTRNPTRSPVLLGDYEVGYTSETKLPSTSFNPRVSYTENGEVIQAFEIMNFGVFASTSTLYSTFNPTGSNSYQLRDERIEREKGLLGSDVLEIEEKRVRAVDILHLDDRVLIEARQLTAVEPDRSLVVLIKKGITLTPQVEKRVQSDISNGGGIAGRTRKITGATQAEKKYKQEMEVKQQKAEAKITEKEAKAEANRLQKEKQAKEEAIRLQKEKAAAEKVAREEAARLQKEKAAAEREAELKLKAEIKDSVDGFGNRLKEAQSNKKDAVAALKSFERENSEVLKEAEIVRKRLADFEAEVTGLSNEVAAMAEDEKQSAAELRDCRRELADLERKLSTL